MNVMIAELDFDAEVDASVSWYETRWRKAHGHIRAIGERLIADKQRFPNSVFTQMIEDRLPFGADTARRFMRITLDPKLAKHATLHVLPDSYAAQDELRKLSDDQFEAAVGAGRITPQITVAESREVVREFSGHAAPAPFATDSAHRTESAKIGPPTAPREQHATSWPELLWLMINRRKSLGISQLDLDQRIGWGEGQTSKYEIPHADDGRIPGAKAMFEWMQALKIGVSVVAL